MAGRVAITESKVPPSPKYLPISTFAEKVSQSLNWQGLVQTHLQNGTLSPKKTRDQVVEKGVHANEGLQLPNWTGEKQARKGD